MSILPFSLNMMPEKLTEAKLHAAISQRPNKLCFSRRKTLEICNGDFPLAKKEAYLANTSEYGWRKNTTEHIRERPAPWQWRQIAWHKIVVASSWMMRGMEGMVLCLQGWFSRGRMPNYTVSAYTSFSINHAFSAVPNVWSLLVLLPKLLRISIRGSGFP